MTLSRDDLLDIIAEEAKIDRARLVPDATLESLDIASLDLVSMLFAVEDRTGVEIAPEDLTGAETLGDLLDIVTARIAAA